MEIYFQEKLFLKVREKCILPSYYDLSHHIEGKVPKKKNISFPFLSVYGLDLLLNKLSKALSSGKFP